MRRLINRLKIQHKLALLCSAFLLPIGFLTFLFVVDTEKDVSFAAKELQGIAYLAALKAELEHVVALAYGAGSSADLASAQAGVLSFDRLQPEGVNSAAAAAKAAEAVRDAQRLPKGSTILAYEPAFSAVLDHISRVADDSNLTLDPVLDSFYVQDLVTEKIPALVVGVTRALGAALEIAASDHPSPEMTVQFLTRKGKLAAVLNAVDADLIAGQRGNRDGTMKPAFDTLYAEVANRGAAYMQLLDELASPGAPRPTIEALRTAAQALQQSAGVFWEAALKELDHLVRARIASVNNSMAWSLALVCVVFLGSLALAWAIAGSISRPLYRLHQTMHALALGDLAVAVPDIDRRDEVGLMAKDVEVFKRDAIELGRLADQIMASTRQIALATSQASSAIGQVSEGANDQLEALRQVAAAVKQSTAAITDVSGSTQRAHKLSASIARQMNEGRERIRATADVVKGSAENAKQVEKMAQSISRIADQTHMLALNAAIEAARAGEHSRGFAVVAEEVRKLAEHSGELAQEIGQVVRSATEESQNAVAMVEEVSSKMDSISESVRRSDTLTAAVATAMEEQQSTVVQIDQTVNGLTRIAQSNATAAEEITSTMIDLSRLAEQSRGQVERFARAKEGAPADMIGPQQAATSVA
jgi:methyl-accepting chemotaxis protein